MSELVERVEASWRDLMAAVEGIPQEQLSEPGVVGAWSVKDVLAHIAFWEDGLVETIERKLAGVPQPESDGDDDFESLNQREYEARKDWTAERVLDDLRRGHERLLTSIRTSPSLTDDEIKEETWEHYDEHAASIRDWRRRLGV